MRLNKNTTMNDFINYLYHYDLIIILYQIMNIIQYIFDEKKCFFLLENTII
jgi:hypothetical protein